jgi:signal peptidase II
MIARSSSLIVNGIIFAAIFLIDRITKYLAVLYIPENGYKISPMISFEVVFNRGISWGIFHGYDTGVFLAISTVIILVLIALGGYTYSAYMSGHNVTGHVIAFVGAFSNIIDRIVFGGVIDFIVLSLGGWSWPVFNVADIAVVCGVLIMVGWDRR